MDTNVSIGEVASGGRYEVVQAQPLGLAPLDRIEPDLMNVRAKSSGSLEESRSLPDMRFKNLRKTLHSTQSQAISSVANPQ